MKKILSIMLLLTILFIPKYSYAIETSIGINWAMGSIVNRGQGYKNFNDVGEELGLVKRGVPIVFDFTLGTMIEFKDYLALETGIELNISGGVHYGPDRVSLFKLREGFGFTRSIISVPVMVRFQKEWSRVLLYASVGPKFNFETYGFIHGSDNYNNVVALAENRLFTMDIGFATGIEFRLGKANYFGIRANYNLNVLAPATFQNKELYHDTYNVGFTYRYAFGSKWKK